MKFNFNTKNYIRDAIGNYMVDIGGINDKVVIVNADLMGTCRNKSFVEKYSHRSFNVGIAEQNMVSFAAGLAHEGFIPYAFSMAPFITMRACEQCRTDVAYANANVRLIGVYAGCSGGISGVTHWGIEDCAIMSSMPNMVVLEPSSSIQAQKMLDASILYDGPIYIRSTVEPTFEIYDANDKYEIGKGNILKIGKDAMIVASGVTVQYALQAVAELNGKFDVGVIDMHTIKPIDKDILLPAIKTGNVLVVQDHNVIGGLGYAVASVIAESGIKTNFKILGVPDKFVPMAHAAYLYHQFGYDVQGIKKSVMDMINS